jgi:hypothetical protein
MEMNDQQLRKNRERVKKRRQDPINYKHKLEYDRQYRKINRNTLNEYQKEYWQKNIDERRKYMREWRRQYYIKNREKLLLKQKVYDERYRLKKKNENNQ